MRDGAASGARGRGSRVAPGEAGDRCRARSAPIFDADLKLHAFELLYRAVGEDGRPIDGGRATATVLVAALGDVGLQLLSVSSARSSTSTAIS